MNLVSLLVEWAERDRERPALVDHWHGRDRVVTFGELVRRMAAGARVLQGMGLRRGQTILVFQPVSIELYELLLAAFYSGMRVMLADPAAGRAFLTDCCRRLRPDAFFGSWRAQCLRLAVPELRRIRLAIRAGGWFPNTRAWRLGAGTCPLVEVAADEPALVTFTSGSTGLPKAALRTHGFLLAQHRALARALVFEEGEVDLITLPVFVLANLASGLTSVLAATDLAKPGTPDAAAIRRQCARFQVTRCTASPAFFEGLLGVGGMPAFNKVFTGGAPVFPDLLRRLHAALPGAMIHSVYGSTEAEPIAHLAAAETDAATVTITQRGGGLCAGTALAEIELRVIADHWGTPLGPMSVEDLSNMTLAPEWAGEIIVSGAHVLSGYLGGHGDDETKIAVEGRVWHRTGDAGWLDERGRVWLLGRAAAKLPPFPAAPGLPAEALSYPFAIECALREMFPQIRMAALEWQGRRLLVVGRRCATAEAERIRAAACEYGIEEVVYLEKLPLDRRHNAKIDYPALRKALARHTAARRTRATREGHGYGRRGTTFR
jgi:acyl-CoA synthetase (AMP-forming)/AMP-acid ligase II